MNPRPLKRGYLVAGTVTHRICDLNSLVHTHTMFIKKGYVYFPPITTITPAGHTAVDAAVARGCDSSRLIGQLGSGAMGSNPTKPQIHDNSNHRESGVKALLVCM